jgi:hypothetical protein
MAQSICCDICAKNFSDGARCPRVMPCGHSLCHTCAVDMIPIAETFPCQRCPSCRAPFRAPFSRAEDMPKNWAVLSILQSIQPVLRARDCPPALPSVAKAGRGCIRAEAAKSVSKISQLPMAPSICCDICVENFSNGARCPRIMPCGHSVCHTCAVCMMPDQRCPSCRAPFSVTRAEDMPKNWAVLGILQSIQPVPRARDCPPALPSVAKAGGGCIQAEAEGASNPRDRKLVDHRDVSRHVVSAQHEASNLNLNIQIICRLTQHAEASASKAFLKPQTSIPKAQP